MKRPTTSTPISLKNKKLKTSHNIDFEQIEMICENKEKATEMIIELIIENQDLRAQLSNQSISLLNSNNFDCSIQSSVNQPENSTTNSLTSFDESILKTSFVSTNLEKKKNNSSHIPNISSSFKSICFFNDWNGGKSKDEKRIKRSKKNHLIDSHGSFSRYACGLCYVDDSIDFYYQTSEFDHIIKTRLNSNGEVNVKSHLESYHGVKNINQVDQKVIDKINALNESFIKKLSPDDVSYTNNSIQNEKEFLDLVKSFESSNKNRTSRNDLSNLCLLTGSNNWNVLFNYSNFCFSGDLNNNFELDRIIKNNKLDLEDEECLSRFQKSINKISESTFNRDVRKGRDDFKNKTISIFSIYTYVNKNQAKKYLKYNLKSDKWVLSFKDYITKDIYKYSGKQNFSGDTEDKIKSSRVSHHARMNKNGLLCFSIIEGNSEIGCLSGENYLIKTSGRNGYQKGS